MSVTNFELTGSITGKSSSPSIPIATTGPVHVVYEAHKCYSAWLEITPIGSATSIKVPFISNKDVPELTLGAGSTVKIVGSVPPGGYLKGMLVY